MTDLFLSAKSGYRTLRNQTTFFERLAGGLWLTCVTVISIIVMFRPQRCITHVYRDAAHHWWSSLPLYSDGIHGFLYLPSGAVLFTPFAYLPYLMGSMAWRWLSFGLLTWGLWRLARLALPEPWWRPALCVILLAIIPASTVNLVRAQSEIIMAALMIHGAVDLGRAQWGRAAFALCLAVALKPIALVMVLLTAALMPPMRGRLVLGLVAVVALPFLHPDPGYVLAQYQAMVQKLLIAADPGAGRWNELTALLARFGLHPSADLMTAVRAGAALITLTLSGLALHRQGPARGAIFLLALALVYQLLFNPRTEEGSYLNLAVMAALFAGFSWYQDQRRLTGWLLIALCLALGTHMYGDWLYRPTDLWLKPLLALAFLGFLARRVWLLPVGPDQTGPIEAPRSGGALSGESATETAAAAAAAG